MEQLSLSSRASTATPRRHSAHCWPARGRSHWRKDTWQRRARAGTRPRWCSSLPRPESHCSTARWSDRPQSQPPWNPPATGTLGSSAMLGATKQNKREKHRGWEIVNSTCTTLSEALGLMRSESAWTRCVHLTCRLPRCISSPAVSRCPWGRWEACCLCGRCTSCGKEDKAARLRKKFHFHFTWYKTDKIIYKK